MGTDTKVLLDAARWCEDGGTPPDFDALARACRDAVDEIDVLRETAKRLADEAEALRKGGAGPSAEERLTRYRAGALAGLLAAPDVTAASRRDAKPGQTFGHWIAGQVEQYAQNTLAAERPASPPPNEERGYDAGVIDGQVTGASAVLKQFDEWVKVIDFGLPLTAEDMREWSAAMRREMGLGEA